jgi:hypothetical protein
MSYSFAIKASNKTDAKHKIAENFDNIVNNQPTHSADRNAVVAIGSAFVDLLEDPADNEEIYVNVYGSLGWRQRQENPVSTFTNAQVSINASVRVREK